MQAVEQSIQDSAAAQKRYEELSAERLQSMAQAIATDAAVINYLDAAIAADSTELALDSAQPDAAAQAVGAAQNLSIRDLILERRDAMGFGLALVLDAEGSVVAHSGESEAFADAYQDDPLLGSVFDSLEPAIGYWRESDVIYHAAATPIAKGDLLVGFLLIAMPVDRTFCTQIHETSGAHAAVWRIEPQGLRLQASSLPDAQQQALAEQAPVFAGLDADAASLPMTLLGEHFLTRNRAMRAQADAEPMAVLMALGSADAAAAGFLRLREQILIATAVAVGMALLLAWWLSRRLVLPVLRAAEAAELAAAGNYQQTLPDTGRDELGRLSQAVNLLLSDLRERRDVESYVGSLQRLQAEPMPEVPSLPRVEPQGFVGWTVLALDLPQFVATPDPAQTERPRADRATSRGARPALPTAACGGRRRRRAVVEHAGTTVGLGLCRLQGRATLHSGIGHLATWHQAGDVHGPRRSVPRRARCAASAMAGQALGDGATPVDRQCARRGLVVSRSRRRDPQRTGRQGGLGGNRRSQRQAFPCAAVDRRGSARRTGMRASHWHCCQRVPSRRQTRRRPC